MPASHPPTLLTLAERALRKECGVERGDSILIAVSGGPDSQALLHVLARLAPRHRLRLFAHGVDHGLRPEAASELDLAAELARSLDVPFSRSRVKVAAGGNLQARARAARYDALARARARTGAALLATAHHADDRAETLLMRLLRGAGARGLAVLPPRADERIRPLLRARRSDVIAHVSRHALPHALDPSNENRRFLRVRVRREVLPLLESLSPRVVDHLTALADELCEGPQPPLLIADGAPIPLGRAHLTAVRRLMERRSASDRVLLPGGRELRHDPERGLVLEKPSHKTGPRRRGPTETGGSG